MPKSAKKRPLQPDITAVGVGISDGHSVGRFIVAALGASAGGLEALEGFFKRMPPDARVAFIVVQHLSPDHGSALGELLARCTDMPVEQARDNTKVAPDRVYVIPPNATLTIQDCILHVAPPTEARGRRTPIDGLFCSLAEDCGEDAVCIMLSGTGTDGTRGLRAIKEHGGMAMAQSLASAKYDAMLRSAIATGLVDHVLPVEDMPAKLMEYAAHLGSLNGNSSDLREQITKFSARIHGVLRRRAGHDFSQYKEGTIARRLERRMKALQIDGVDEYVKVLESQAGEVDLLFKDLLIGVTEFFRNPEAFDALSREVIPRLFEQNDECGQIRACVVGCATGEEAYSIAMLLCEHASTLDKPLEIKLFATDIDERSLEIARKGLYPAGIAEHVSAERLARFFIKQDGSYQVKRELRDLCLFSAHSFLKDPPFSRLDLVSCRNVMIYLGDNLQRKVVPLFHYALRPDGFLFLGPSETVSAHRDLFRSIDKKYRIFQKKDSLPRVAVAFPLGEIARVKASGGKQPQSEDQLPKRLERIILSRYAPACVIVNEIGNAIYFSGGVSRYLEQPTGSPDNNVVNMAREGLRIPLRAALHRAATTRENTVQREIPVQILTGEVRIDLLVEPLSELKDATLFTVVITDSPQPAGKQGAAVPVIDAGSEEIIRHLENELQLAREHAQTMFEELESSNEELSSANEEFQSTNEELETSKEELQSFNEELETVNAELNRRVTELDAVNSDLQNLSSSTQIATIFLDVDLNVKTFTPAAGTMFHLLPSDVGRPITDLAAQFIDGYPIQDAKEVLATLALRERQVTGANGRYYQERILPYRTVNNVIAGIVLAFLDVTDLRRAEQFAQDARRYAESIVDTVREPLVVLNSGNCIISASKAFYERFQVSPGETVGKSLFELGNRQWDIPQLRLLLSEMLTKKQRIDDYEVDHQFLQIGHRVMLLNGRRLDSGNDNNPLFLLAIEDITDRKRIELERRDIETRERAVAVTTAVREMETELARVSRALTVGELATSIAHEVNQPLAGIVTNAEAARRWLSAKTPNIVDAQQSLGLIIRDGNRASDVIRRIRELLRKDGPHAVSLDMNEVIRETLAFAQAELLKSQVAIELQLSPELPPVRADRVQLQQVILNLIMNGSEAMAAVNGLRELTVTSQRFENNGVLVSVRDFGTGVSGQILVRMFEAFFTTKPSGMGMGLSISRSIVDAHGGRIWATPNEGPGVTVQFSIPGDDENK